MSITQNAICEEYLFTLKCFLVPTILEEDFLDHFLEGVILFPINATWKPIQSQKYPNLNNHLNWRIFPILTADLKTKQVLEEKASVF